MSDKIIFPEKCLCSLKSCYHILAVKKSLGMKIKQKPTPNMSALSAADKKPKAGRKRPRPGDFDYILEDNGQTSEKKGIKNDPIEMSDKISDKFVTTQRKPITSVTIERYNVTEIRTENP